MIYEYRGTALGPKKYISQAELDVLPVEIRNDYAELVEEHSDEDDLDDNIDCEDEDDEDYSEEDYDDM